MLVWMSSGQAADSAVGLWLGRAAVSWEPVPDDTELRLPMLVLQMQQDSFVLAAVLSD